MAWRSDRFFRLSSSIVPVICATKFRGFFASHESAPPGLVRYGLRLGTACRSKDLPSVRKEGIASCVNCGEDSFFTATLASHVAFGSSSDCLFYATKYRQIGVADGVGGWRKIGVDPGLFARHLMQAAKEIASMRNESSPLKLLSGAYNQMVELRQVTAGKPFLLLKLGSR